MINRPPRYITPYLRKYTQRDAQCLGRNMKKLFILLVLVVFAASMKAQARDVQAEQKCRRTLTSDYSHDSQSFTMDLSTLDIRDYGNDHVAKSIKVIRELLEDLGCQKHAVKFGVGPQGRAQNKCWFFDPNNRDISRVCYVVTNLGIFTTQHDYLDKMIITYKRFD